jgi:excisionase family DNA binding protein
LKKIGDLPESRKALVVQLTTDELRTIVEDAVRSALKSAPKEDRLLTVDEVCKILNVPKGWLYHRAKQLPFTRKIGGNLRFSANGLQRYIESAKFTVKGD